MAITALVNIKNWFKTGLIPTQTQFWDTWDSFWHKDDLIPVAKIEGIDALLLAKAEKADFDNHLTNPDAHPQLLSRAKFVQIGEFTVWKHPTNNNPANKFVLEVNDMVMGFVDINWIHGWYLGGDIGMVENFDVIVIQ